MNSYLFSHITTIRCLENGRKKAYGAGLLSSFGELEYACRSSSTVDDNKILNPNEVEEEQQINVVPIPISSSTDYGTTSSLPKFIQWNPEVASIQDFPITVSIFLYY